MNRLTKNSLLLAMTIGLSGSGHGNQGTSSGTVAVFMGPHDGFGDIVLIEEVSGAEVAAPKDLANLRWLPIDAVGRTELEALLTDRAQRVEDVGDEAARLRMPNAQGSLYFYERVGGRQRHHFGFLWIDKDGRPLQLGDRPGISPLMNVSPYAGKVAVSPDGSAFLAATKVEAGGDLIEFRKNPTTSKNLTASIPPQAFSTDGMWHNGTWGFAMTDTGVLHFYPESPTARWVKIGDNQPAWYSGQAVVSRNRRHALFTAGHDTYGQAPFLIDSTGHVQQVVDSTAPIAPAGFLPEYISGPFMAVSDNGEFCAWRRDGHTSEVFSSTSPGGLPIVGEQLTGNDNFSYYLEEIGQIGFYKPNRLTFAVAERPADPILGGLDLMDMFQAELSQNQPTELMNLTVSSGEPVVPFLNIPNITPDRLQYVPDADRFLMVDSEHHELLEVIPDQSGATTRLTNVDDVKQIVGSGDHLVLQVRLDGMDEVHQLLRSNADLSTPSAILDPGGADFTFTQIVPRGDGMVAYVREGAGVRHIVRADLQTGFLESLPLGAQDSTGPIGFTTSGSVQFTLEGVLDHSTTWIWHASGTVVQVATLANEDVYLLPIQ